MLCAQNCIIANAVLCEVLSIWWRPTLNYAVNCYRNFIGNHMICFTDWHKAVHTFFRQVLLISEWHLHIFYFETQETNLTKIPRKLWRARLQIGVEGVKGKERTFTHPPAFFLPLIFEKIQPKLYRIFNCDFWIWPLCTFTDRISQTHEEDPFWCM